MKKLLLLCLLALGGWTAGSAAVIPVCGACTHTTIASAIAAAASGDTIDIQDPVHTEDAIIVDKSLTFQGQGQSTTIVQAAATQAAADDQVFLVYFGLTVTFRDFTIQNGNAISSGSFSLTTGGGVWINSNASANTTFERMTITNNRSNSSAGGVYVVGIGGTLSFMDCVISNNEANTASSTADGGGILNQSATDFKMIRCTVNGNACGDDGGGVYVSEVNSVSQFINCTIFDNEAGGGGGSKNLGGGLEFLTGQSFELINCTVVENNLTGSAATRDGGGINWDRGSLTLTNTIVANNTGAISGNDVRDASSGTLTIHTSLVEDCSNCSVSPTYTTDPNLASAATCGEHTYFEPQAPSDALDNGTAPAGDIPTDDICGHVRLAPHDLGSYDATACDPDDLALNPFQNSSRITINLCEGAPVGPTSISDSLFKYASDIGINTMSASLVFFDDNGGSQGGLYNGTGEEPTISTASSGNNHFWVSQEIDGCVGTAIRLRMDVRTMPSMTLEASDTLLCPGDMIDLAGFVTTATNVRRYEFFDADPSSNPPFMTTGNNGNANGRLPDAAVNVTPAGDGCYWIVGSREFGSVQNLRCYSIAYKITVDVDTDAPTFTCPSGVQRFNTDPGVCEWTVPGTGLDPTNVMDDHNWTMTNDYNGIATLQGAIFPKGKTTVTWTFSDDCGNMTTCTYDVRVRDREKPVFDNCPDDANLLVPFCTPGIVHTWPQITATDNCTGPNGIVYSPAILSGSTFPVGTTTVMLTATDRAGNVAPCSFDVNVAEDCDPLPSGMGLIDIGNTGGVAGKTCYDAATKTYEIKTSGSGIPGAIPSSDGFHYVVTPSSDMVVDVKARIVQHPTNTNRDRVGVMIRKSDPANSASVSTLIAGDNRTYMVNRPTDGMFASSIAGPILPGPLWPGPVYWVRLHKIGTVYYGYVSPDGVAWTLISVQTAAITGSFGVGIAATAGTPGSTVHYIVDNVSINGTAYRQGKNGLEPLAVAAFPNPTQDRLNVELAAPAFSQVELSLSNAMGQKLLVERFEADASGIISRRLEMGDLAAGMYMLEVKTATESKTIKVVKK